MDPVTDCTFDKDELFTVGDLANATGCKVEAVKYFIRRKEIPFVRRAGNYRLFDRAVLNKLRNVLSERSRM